ncbi:hypothetical protein K461DRAFT_292341 [Myriangium duriaei CBS 260.36]|uniref:Uncharacterized protein n=1 Tax=Myriangium duriaei CBS 260.36 TaxID=1168546 RepID=A0A9P4J779_9PEZI|nr:hypothetical protein K461DRAFT_292341 [Myriangium duriaei CBS 260.36]
MRRFVDYTVPHVLQPPKDDGSDDDNDGGIGGLGVEDEGGLGLGEGRDGGDGGGSDEGLACSERDASAEHEEGGGNEPSTPDNPRDSLRLGSSGAAASTHKRKRRSEAERLLNAY